MAQVEQARPPKPRRSRCLIVLLTILAALIVGLGGLFWYAMRPFSPRTVDLLTVRQLTQLSFPSGSKLVNSRYEEMPRGYLLARVQMTPDQLAQFKSEGIPARAEWRTEPTQIFMPKTYEGVDWWQPPTSAGTHQEAAYNAPRSTTPSDTWVPTAPDEAWAKMPRMVSVLVATAPSHISDVYVWSIVD